MAKLRGGVQGHRGAATRLSHDRINVWANTWESILDIDLWADGQYRIDIRPYGYGDPDRKSKLIVGNAHEDVKPLPPVKPKKPRVRRPKPEPVCILE